MRDGWCRIRSRWVCESPKDPRWDKLSQLGQFVPGLLKVVFSSPKQIRVTNIVSLSRVFYPGQAGCPGFIQALGFCPGYFCPGFFGIFSADLGLVPGFMDCPGYFRTQRSCPGYICPGYLKRVEETMFHLHHARCSLPSGRQDTLPFLFERNLREDNLGFFH